MTSASYSVASLLLNGRHPVSKKKLFFPYLEEPVFELISQNMLNGGYSVNSSMYNHHNFGYAMHGNTDPDNVSAALYCDYNSLYPSSLQASQFCISCKNKADRHKSRAPSLQRRTDRPTDRPTDRVAYRVACTRLKMISCNERRTLQYRPKSCERVSYQESIALSFDFHYF